MSLGCTPLHWAAIRGNLEACTVLVQAGKKDDLMVTDNTGFTPAQLASDKNHRQVAFFLKIKTAPDYSSYLIIMFVIFWNVHMQGNARRLLEKRWDANSRLGKISKLGLAPGCLLIFLVGIGAMYGSDLKIGLVLELSCLA
ncbi:hypothetical protein ACLOJK_027601 [Asimina triloba]